MASSIPCSGRVPLLGRFGADARRSRAASRLIALIAMLFAALLIATPPLALLTAPADLPVAPHPVPLMSFSVSQLA
ncbi:hypothetical protein [Xanthobacter agilis]|uniref:Uncharacterized protein n=1 Tax=Xanthobacter agilis TaxID=47492 RepID=A0ABU0LC62_XANAG|nr:hypothetical protein [Xanthobacter agilis]MDQ0504725.1 hypothetical protein [Xanthobacter agilis]